MNAIMHECVVRIRSSDPDHTIKGTGFLVTKSTILTCAHVVEEALNLDRGTLDCPTENILIDFTHFQIPEPLKAKVIHWQPYISDDEGDVAVLELEEDSPIELAPAQLVDMNARQLAGHTFESYGFPAGTVAGVWSEGVLGNPVGRGERLQVQGSNDWGQFIKPGFSGAPVYVKDLGGVVGMVVTMQTEPDLRVAYIIPVESLVKTWERLTPIIFDSLRNRWERNLLSQPELLRIDSPLPDFRSVASPLVDIWNNFIREDRWHDRIAEQIDQLDKNLRAYLQYIDAPEFEALLHAVQAIDPQGNYETILGQLHHLPYRRVNQYLYNQLQKHTPHERILNEIRSALQSISKMTDSPIFQRCFFVMGGMGSGKTHFIRSLLTSGFSDSELYDIDMVRPNNSLFLCPEAPYRPKANSGESFADLLLKTMRETAQMTWADLESLDCFLERANNFSFYQSRLVVVLDDLARWMRWDEHFVQELMIFIREHTHLHNLYWIITIPQYLFPRLPSQTPSEQFFWLEYGAVDRDKYSLKPDVSGWLALDEINEQDRLARAFINRDFMERNLDFTVVSDWLAENQTSLHYLSNPLIALLWLKQIREMPLEQVINLNYIQFIEHFKADHIQKLVALLQGSDYADHLSPFALDQFVRLAAKVLLKGHKRVLPQRTLLAEIREQAKGHFDIEDETLAKQAYDVVRRGFLIKSCDYRADQLTAAIPEAEVEFRFQTFWAFLVAQEISIQLHQQNPNAGGLQGWLKEQFGLLSDPEIQESVLEFLILLEDQREGINDPTRSFTTQLCEAVLTCSELPKSSVWYSGLKVSLPVQQMLFERTDLIAQKPDRSTLFAYMSFVSSVSLEVGSFAERMQLIQPHYMQIAENALSDYFVSLVQRMISRIEEAESLLSGMSYFFGCEVMQAQYQSIYEEERVFFERNFTHELAAIILNRVVELVDEKLGDIAAWLLHYLVSVVEEYPDPHDIPGQDNGWSRYLLREWMMFEFCDHVLRRLSADQAYEFLQQLSWYSHPALRQNHCLRWQMEQEANIAFGFTFRRLYQNDTGAFVNFVEDLSTSRSVHDRINAFHIIRHTKPTQFDRDVIVSEDFQHILGQLFLDPTLDKTIISFYGFFKHNLADFKRLEHKRHNRRGHSGHKRTG